MFDKCEHQQQGHHILKKSNWLLKLHFFLSETRKACNFEYEVCRVTFLKNKKFKMQSCNLLYYSNEENSKEEKLYFRMLFDMA